MSKIIDQKKVLGRLEQIQPLKLELGCGASKRNCDAIGIDVLDYACVDLCGDVFEALHEFPANCVDSVYSHHFVEHIEDLDLLMNELGRVVKPGGGIEFVAPHFSNPYFYSDPTHRRFFGLYTFCYFAHCDLFQRKVPTYGREIVFTLECVDLCFKSSRPFYGRYAIKVLLGKIFNSCRYLRELYEENFCYLFPCYEITYKLRRVDSGA